MRATPVSRSGPSRLLLSRGPRVQARPSSGSPTLTGVPETPRYLPHLRHHWCGSWGIRPSAQVSPEVGLLARCGGRPGVLLSTRGQLDGCAPGRRDVHPFSPVHPRAIPRPGGPTPTTTGCSATPSPPLRGVVAGQAPVRDQRSRTASSRRRLAQVTRRDLAHTRPSPDCAHSWGQLLDVSTRMPQVGAHVPGCAEVRRLSTAAPPAVDNIRTPSPSRLASSRRASGRGRHCRAQLSRRVVTGGRGS